MAGAATSVQFAGDVTLADGDTATNLAGAVTLDGLNWSGYDGLTTGALTLSTAAVDINSQGGNIQFASIAGGSQDLSLNAGVAAGTTTVTGNVTALGDGTGAALTVDNSATGLVDFQGTFAGNSGLVAGAATSVQFAGDVTLADGDTATNLAGAVTLDGLNWSGYDGLTTGALTLSTAAVDINSQGGNIQTGSVTGGSQNLTFNSGATGTVTVTGALAGVPTLDVTNSNGVTFNDSVTVTTFDISDTEDGQTVQVDGSATITTLTTTGNGYNVSLLGGGTITNDPNFLNTGTLQIGNDSSDTTTFSGGLRTNAVSGTTLGGTIADGGANQLTFGGVTLAAATTLDSQGGNIAMTSLAGGSQDLTIAAGVAAGTTTVTGNVELRWETEPERRHGGQLRDRIGRLPGNFCRKQWFGGRSGDQRTVCRRCNFSRWRHRNEPSGSGDFGRFELERI